MKLWSGRFQKETDDDVSDFNSSIHIDCRMYEEDIKGSIAHVNMLYKSNILSIDEKIKIVGGLESILDKIKSGNAIFSRDNEDIHMNIEVLLIKEIGDVAKKMHTARSRNDQVALDIRMYLKKEINELKNLILEFQMVIAKRASENIKVMMPGYTHLQRAQPISFAHHILAYSEMFKRDLSRLEECYNRINVMPLGAGALATTTYSIDRDFVKEQLGFGSLCMNSIDAVSDRDFIVELASDISISMMHLSRFSEEVILWSSFEFGFIELDDSYSTGSSIMPQKKNPDIAELVRGKCGRVYGDLIAVLTMLKGIPLAYNKDMQEDKEIIFDAIDTFKECICIFTSMINTMKINKAKMHKACTTGFINATDLADYLVKNGMAFRDAHKIVGEIVFYCIQKDKSLEEVSIDEFKLFSELIKDDVYKFIDLFECLESRDVVGGPSSVQVEKRIFELNNYISEKSL